MTMTFRRRLLITACAATGMTERAARRLGAGYFLPALFAQRYANMGGLDAGVLAKQMRACRSFRDADWTGYWDAIAEAELGEAITRFRAVGVACSWDGSGGGDALPALDASALAEVLAPVAGFLADHSLRPTEREVDAWTATQANGALAATAPSSIAAVQAYVRAVTYLQISAFPGGTPLRTRAYHRSRALFDALADAVGSGLSTSVERRRITVGAHSVDVYLCLPHADAPIPAVVVTNGLEGTVQELLIPLLRYHATGLGVLVMEMPGAYDSEQPMSGASEEIYRAVIDALAADVRVDGQRLGIVGVSFGGYWAARMAAADQRLRCAVACGAPTDRSFLPRLGIPEVILEALAHVTGAPSPPALLRRLRALSLRGRYHEITQPLLVINGASDTLLSTADSRALARGARQAQLVLYAGDDHCAMGHYRTWLDLTQRWLADQLLTRAPSGQARP